MLDSRLHERFTLMERVVFCFQMRPTPFTRTHNLLLRQSRNAFRISTASTAAKLAFGEEFVMVGEYVGMEPHLKESKTVDNEGQPGDQDGNDISPVHLNGVLD